LGWSSSKYVYQGNNYNNETISKEINEKTNEAISKAVEEIKNSQKTDEEMERLIYNVVSKTKEIENNIKSNKKIKDFIIEYLKQNKTATIDEIN